MGLIRAYNKKKIIYIKKILKKNLWLLSGIVVYLCVKTSFPLPCVCVCLFLKKKEKKNYEKLKKL